MGTLASQPSRPRPVVVLAVALAGIVSACASHADHTKEARSALDAHKPDKALALYNEELGVSSGSELPADDDDDAALFLMDRAMIQQQLRRYPDSSRDLETADKRVEMLDFSRSTADEIGRYLFSDDTGPYKARPFEKLLINTMNMVNYLAQGNLNGAKIEARRFAIMQKYLKEHDDEEGAELLGPGSYLAGFIFEQAGEPDEALRFYDEALAATPYASLAEPVRRMAQRSGYRSPRITQVLEQGAEPEPTDGTGELLLVVNYGRVPALKAERVPIGLALTYASMYMAPEQNQAARRLAGQGLVTWVNYPALEKSRASYGSPYAELDGKALAVDRVLSVDTLVRKAYEKNKGRIMASAIVRMITRGVAGAAIGTGAGKSSGSGAIGMLAGLVTQATLTAVDTPDTRSWATLPARIALVRVRVTQGKHRIRVGALGANRVQDVDVRDGGFTVVNLTELSQY